MYLYETYTYVAILTLLNTTYRELNGTTQVRSAVGHGCVLWRVIQFFFKYFNYIKEIEHTTHFVVRTHILPLLLFFSLFFLSFFLLHLILFLRYSF